MEVGQRHIDTYFSVGHRQQEYVLERLPHLLGFIRRQPFLEEGGEGGAVQDFPCRSVFFQGAHDDLSVALERGTVKVDAPSGPAFDAVQVGEGDVLPGCVTAEDIIDPERAVGQAYGRLAGERRGCGQDEKEKEDSFHISKIIFIFKNSMKVIR